jgi:sortase A
MKLSTIFIILGMLIISLYCLIDVSFYASQLVIENNDNNTPVVIAPTIGVSENINNKSIFYGVYHEPRSFNPGNGTVILFGHRTLYGSPFLNLDKLKKGDTVYLDWPGIGKVKYTVEKSFIVEASYLMPVDQGQTLFLITCHPVGSTKQRLIVQAKLDKIEPFQKTTRQDNPQNYYAILIILGFLIGGLAVTYMYPVDEDKIILLGAVIALTLFLVCAYVFPVPPDFISSKLSDINNLMGI